MAKPSRKRRRQSKRTEAPSKTIKKGLGPNAKPTKRANRPQRTTKKIAKERKTVTRPKSRLTSAMKRIMAALIYGKHAALGNSRLNSTLPKKSGYTSQKLSSIGISHNTFVRKSRNKNQTACHRGQGAGHPGQVQQASGEGSGEGSRNLGAKPSQVERVP